MTASNVGYSHSASVNAWCLFSAACILAGFKAAIVAWRVVQTSGRVFAWWTGKLAVVLVFKESTQRLHSEPYLWSSMQMKTSGSGDLKSYERSAGEGKHHILWRRGRTSHAELSSSHPQLAAHAPTAHSCLSALDLSTSNLYSLHRCSGCCA